jgi:hypothetical protein
MLRASRGGADTGRVRPPLLRPPNRDVRQVQEPSGVTDTRISTSPVAVLGQLKTMLDQGLITQELYAEKQQEVLGRM